MGLVRGQTKRVDIPDEPGEWVEIKKLPWGLLDGAREARTKAVIESAKLWGTDMMAAINSGARKPPEDSRPPAHPDAPHQEVNSGIDQAAVRAARADRYNEYDQKFLLLHAVQAWSYDAPLPEGVTELDYDTAAWLKREIVDFNNRRRTAAEQLDGTSPSTSS